MNRIAVMGGGAFGTALALVLARGGRNVTLWARDPGLASCRQSQRLPGVSLPDALKISTDPDRAASADVVLIAVPTQALAGFLDTHAARLAGKTLVACCKGIELGSGLGPAGLIRRHAPTATPALISGPGFAADLAAGLPTALTLATEAHNTEALQALLSVDNLRLYLSPDLAGVEVGGALKNVIAIACGAVIGAGFGESARAALLTRGYAEMVRYARSRGAQERTLSGLSGLGDLVLTACSEKSRNYRFGLALGRGEPPAPGVTVEGVPTAFGLASLADADGLDLPVTAGLAQVLDGRLSVAEAARDLLARPLKAE